MIDRIFIPTVNRTDSQITFDNLPNKYKSIVTLVVQAWEKSQYDYDCDYLVLPDTPEYHFSDYYCLPKTRKFIYEQGRNLKYCIFDDDIKFARRNAKYFGGQSNMEKSKRYLNDDDFDEMFNLFDRWLDDVTVCGCSQMENPPNGSFKKVDFDRMECYRNNSSLTSAYWINGSHFTDILDDMDLTSVRVGEDVCFLLNLLTRGYKNRVSGEFVIYNSSNNKKMKSSVWDQQTYEQTQKDHERLQKMFPGIFTILYDENGNRLSGGYRDQGKSKIEWSKAFNYRSDNNLMSFFDDN